MGNWHIAIDGHGVHDNGLDHDAEVRLKQFVEQLLADGHQVHYASITVGGARKFAPATDDEPAHLKYLP
ncbi:MAG TPA: hypothetical protein VN088_19145 [Nocardioides sp.]|nr:hypothetical protein [Nocardioides sp.]